MNGPLKSPFAGIADQNLHSCISGLTFFIELYLERKMDVTCLVNLISRTHFYRRVRKNKFYRVKIIFSSLKSPPNFGSHLDFGSNPSSKGLSYKKSQKGLQSAKNAKTGPYNSKKSFCSKKYMPHVSRGSFLWKTRKSWLEFTKK